jgi:predicted nucleic acid-binding protein
VRFFLDSNVLIYALGRDDPRRPVARALLEKRGYTSVQVLGEFAAVALRKLGRSWSEVSSAVALIRGLCSPPVPLTTEILETGLRIGEAHKYQMFDACIIGAALHAGCNTLYSEDMHDGHVIDGRLTIRNPFAA